MRSLSEVIELGKSGKIPYPKLVDLLAEAEVKNYVTDVATRRITYFGLETPFVEQSPGSPLQIADDFNEKEVINAIKRTQKRETTYPQFLEEIAKAGIYKYEVDLIKREITYISKKGQYKELIPKI